MDDGLRTIPEGRIREILLKILENGYLEGDLGNDGLEIYSFELFKLREWLLVDLLEIDQWTVTDKGKELLLDAAGESTIVEMRFFEEVEGVPKEIVRLAPGVSPWEAIRLIASVMIEKEAGIVGLREELTNNPGMKPTGSFDNTWQPKAKTLTVEKKEDGSLELREENRGDA